MTTLIFICRILWTFIMTSMVVDIWFAVKELERRL